MVLFAVLVDFVSGSCHVQALCPDLWTQYHGPCYFLFEDMEPWPQASFVCQSHQAHLVTVETAEENSFLKSYIRSKQVHHGDVWIGGNDMMIEGDWRWSHTNEKVTFTDWYPGEPNNDDSQENCTEIHVSYGFKWNDENCPDLKQFMCETRCLLITSTC